MHGRAHITEFEFNDLLERYRQGTATEKERVLIDAWFESNENATRDFIWMRQDEDRQFDSIRNRIGAASEGKEVVPFYVASWLKIAASVIVLLVSSYLLWSVGFANRVMTVTSDAGNTRKTILSDGTLVWLKGGASLEFPRRFHGPERIVRLRGEALFEVSKDAAHPFVIKCGDLNAKVVGTSFNIRASEKDIELLVLTGKVELYQGHNVNPVVVMPNQKVLYDGLPEAPVQALQHGETQKATSGTEYDMAFANTPMQDIVRRIEGKFGKEVRLENSRIEDCLITADFTDQSLDDTLRMIAGILGFAYEIDGDAVIIKGGGCE